VVCMQRSPPGALLRALLALGYVCVAFLAFRSWPQLHRQVEAVASEFTINSAIHFVVHLDLTCTSPMYRAESIPPPLVWVAAP
jgi:hypothetical protein